MVKDRVVITGIGVISNIGNNKEDFWKSLINGKTNISRIENREDFSQWDISQYKSRLVASVNDFNFKDFFPHYNLTDLGRNSQFALAATKQALEDSGLNPQKIKKSREQYSLSHIDMEKCSVILGVGGLIFDVFEDNFTRFIQYNGPSDFSKYLVSNISNSSPAGHIANTFGVHGTNYVITAACASANLAIIESFDRIAHGIDDIVITGGSDAFITPSSYGGFDAMGVLATKFQEEPNRAYRPFDKQRSGMIMGEAAGIIVLESLEHAIQRGANIYCELLGGSSRSDAYHIYIPERSGEYISKTMENALKITGLTPKDIDYINSHGSSTVINDVVETTAIKKVFGEYSKKIPISGTKSMTGHAVGATGGLESISTALAIKNGIIPPTINLDQPDIESGCDLDYVPNQAREKQINNALSNSFGFGGINSSIVLKKYQG